MTSSSPRISVVMPSFNQAEFIEEAVCSVLADTGDEVELVVSDGGSSDDTLDRLAGLQMRFPGRLRWQSAPDGGPAAAINAAARRARAPWLGWLNSDDRYAPGALSRALAHIAAHPDHALFYGEADHVDIAGHRIDRYPTLPPDTPLSAFRDGCFICQPSMFMRRDAFLDAGGLDETLKAAFDFELWLRLFPRHAGRIGFIDEVQAHSRLHVGGITLRFRERVAREGVAVIARHLAPAPVHWLLTHLQELLATHPFGSAGVAPPDRVRGLVDELAASLEPGARQRLAQVLADDWAAAVCGPHWGLSIWPDGWAPPRLSVRVQQPPASAGGPVHGLRLYIEHAHPQGRPVEVRVFGPEGLVLERRLAVNGPQVLDLAVPDKRPEARTVFTVQTTGAFVPRQVEPGSTDDRELAFKVSRVVPLPGS